MTKITFETNENGQFSSLDVIGHSGFAEEGEDIVCAAISSAVMLTHALLYDVQRIPVDTVIEEDGTHIRFTLPQEYLAQGQDGIHAFYMHIKELEQEYKDYISVMEVQVTC